MNPCVLRLLISFDETDTIEREIKHRPSVAPLPDATDPAPIPSRNPRVAFRPSSTVSKQEFCLQMANR